MKELLPLLARPNSTVVKELTIGPTTNDERPTTIPNF
jgi:hypothetical protein